MTEESVAEFATWLTNNGYSSVYSGRLGQYYLQRGDECVRVFTRDGDEWTLEREKACGSRTGALEEYKNLCSGKSHVLHFLGEK